MTWQFWAGVGVGVLTCKGLYLLTVDRATRQVRSMIRVVSVTGLPVGKSDV